MLILQFTKLLSLLLLQPVLAFQTPCSIRSYTSFNQLDRRRLYASTSRGRRGGSGEFDDQPKKSGWDNFKSAVYGGIDFAKSLAEGNDKDIDRVEDGYSDFETSLKRSQSPASKILGEYQERVEIFGSESEAEIETSEFNAFKKNFYNAVDSFGKGKEQESPEPPMLDRNIPYKRSLAQDLNNKDLLSSNPIKRFQAEMEIRESEARRRALERGEKIRAKKEDLYKLVDSFQAAVDSIPEKIEQAEKAARDTSKFIQSVPDRVDSTVEDVKAIPSKVQLAVLEIEESVEEKIETTKKVVDDVKDIPNKVKRKIEDTKRQVVEVKESVDETVTNVKVFVGLEKPKPKPPKLPPPKDPTVQQFVFDVAGGVAKGAGKLTWWATKNVAGLAWNGAKSAFDKTKTNPSTQSALEAASTSPEDATTVVDPSAQQKTIDLSNPTDTLEVEQEVADALRLAEASLRKASIEKKK